MNTPVASCGCSQYKRIASIVLIVLGVALLSWGVMSSDSLGSTISHAFTGSPSGKSIWLLGAGLVLLVTGGLGTFHYRKA